MIMDFSENYACTFQSEAQSGFFDRNQVTIHPIMCYYMEPIQANQIEEESTEHIMVKHPIIAISEDTKHDADAV